MQMAQFSHIFFNLAMTVFAKNCRKEKRKKLLDVSKKILGTNK